MASAAPAGSVRALREEFGRELRSLRLAADLTQEALANLAGYHRVSITQVEKGRQDFSREFVVQVEAALGAGGRLQSIHERLQHERAHPRQSDRPTTDTPEERVETHADDVNRRDVLRQAAALGAAAAMPAAPLGLLAPRDREGPGTSAEDTIVAELRSALLGSQSLLGGLATADGVAHLDALARNVKVAWKLRQQARYLHLGGLLPTLIGNLEAAAHQDGEHTRMARSLLAHAYNATSSVLKKLGDPGLAALAADRAILTARQIEDPVLVAASAYRLANVFQPAGRNAEARELALSAANLLEPSVDVSDVHLATWGALLLTAAVAGAEERDTAFAWELTGEAKAAAGRLDREYVGLHTIFGPTSVALHAVQIAATLGDGNEVLRRAAKVDLGKLPEGLLERRSYFLVNLARGHYYRSNDHEAVSTLLTAERLAPEEIRHSDDTRILVRALLARERRGAVQGLRELAIRTGAAA